MSISAVVFFFCSFLLVVSFLRQGSDIFSPGRLFALVWSVAIGLAELKISRLQETWSTESWFTLILGIAGFLLGIFVAFIVNMNKRLVPIEKMRETVRREPLDSSVFFSFILAGFALYALSYVVTAMTQGFIPIFSLKAALRRTEFAVFGFGVLLHSVVFILFFVVVYHVMARGQEDRKRILKIVAVVTAVTFAFLLQRYQLMMAAVMSFVFLYYTTHRIRASNTAAFLAVAFVLSYAMLSMRTGQIVQQYLAFASKMRVSTSLAFITEPYMYVVMNLENFARGVDRIDHVTYGFLTTDFLLALTGLKHWITDYFQIDMNPYLISGYNTYTSFWSYYRDFGLLGLIGIEFLLGLGVGWLYYRMRQAPTLSLICAYSVAVFVIVLSFFMNVLGLLWFAYNIAVMFLVLRYVSIRSRVVR